MAMRSRSSLGVALAVMAGLSVHAVVASAQGWTPKRTPDGQPDIQGTWVNFDSAPFETPVAGDTPAAGNAGVNPDPAFAVHDSPVSARRKAMVVDPPSGRIPVLK